MRIAARFLGLAVGAALEAADAIMAVYARDFAVDFKADQSPLTDADRAAHALLVARLKPTGVPVVSEEDEEVPYAIRRDWPQHWLVDPLDGTKEFVKRNGDFTVNIALIVGQRPVMGVVLAPVADTLYAGVIGEGAGMIRGVSAQRKVLLAAGDQLAVTAPVFAPLPCDTGAVEGHGGLRMVMSKSHLNPETLAFVERWKQEGVEIKAVSRGSSLKLCLLASGEAEVYPRLGPTMEWDTAAAQAVVEAAGGEVVLFDEAAQRMYREKGPVALGQAGPLVYNKANRLNPFFVARSSVGKFLLV